MLIAVVLGALFCLAGPGVYYGALWFLGTSLSPFWLLLSPVYGLVLVWDFFRTGSSAQFWWNTLINACYTPGLLACAGWLLRSTWHDEPRLQWLLPGWRAGRSQAGSAAANGRCVDRRWLEVNPFAWLVLRDKQPVRLGWMAAMGGAAIWAAGFLVLPGFFGSLLGMILAALVIDGAVGVMAMFAAAKRTGDDRRSGALELLLTTSLPVQELIQGQRQALWAGFRPLLRFLLGLHLALAAISLARYSWNDPAWIVALECWGVAACLIYLALWSHTLSQVVWAALNSGRPLFTIRKVLFQPGVYVAFGYFGYQMFLGGWPRRFPQGSHGELLVTTVILVGAVCLSAFAWFCSPDPGTLRLKKEFRRIAQHPLPEPSDPRWRQWDPTKPFPEKRRWF
jgi:hypothetical protein